MNWITLADLKDRILTLLVNHPKSSVFGIRHLLTTPEGRRCLGTLVQQIGPAYARQLLDSIPERDWREITARTDEASSPDESTARALTWVHRALVAERMTCEPEADMDRAYRAFSEMISGNWERITEEREPSKIALLSAFMSPEEISFLLERFAPDFRKQVILQISRLGRIPAETVKMSALNFLEDLDRTRETPPPLRMEAPQPVAAPRFEIELEPVPELASDLAPAPPKAPPMPESTPGAVAAVPALPKKDPLEAALEKFQRRGLQGREQKLMRFLAMESPEIFRELTQQRPLSGEA